MMRPQKLLVIRLGAMGDLMHVSPSLAAVRAARPDLEIHLLTAPLYRGLAEALPGVDQVWTFDKRQPWREIDRLRRELHGITQVVNLHPSFKTWLLGRLLGPDGSRAYRKQKFKVRGRALRDLPRRHAVADFYEPFRALLDLPPAGHLRPNLPMTAGADGLRIALIPGVGGKRANRAWSVASYRELTRALRRQYPKARLLLVGGPEDRPLAEALAGSGVDDHCGRHDILGTARLLKGCALAIGGDTGPLHLAAALGVPTVGIFGPTSPARTGPLGPARTEVLTPPETLACWPCEYPDCPLPGGENLACMREISVASVLAACERLLDENHAAPTESH